MEQTKRADAMRHAAQKYRPVLRPHHSLLPVAADVPYDEGIDLPGEGMGRELCYEDDPQPPLSASNDTNDRPLAARVGGLLRQYFVERPLGRRQSSTSTRSSPQPSQWGSYADAAASLAKTGEPREAAVRERRERLVAGSDIEFDATINAVCSRRPQLVARFRSTEHSDDGTDVRSLIFAHLQGCHLKAAPQPASDSAGQASGDGSTLFDDAVAANRVFLLSPSARMKSAASCSVVPPVVIVVERLSAAPSRYATLAVVLGGGTPQAEVLTPVDNAYKWMHAKQCALSALVRRTWLVESLCLRVSFAAFFESVTLACLHAKHPISQFLMVFLRFSCTQMHALQDEWLTAGGVCQKLFLVSGEAVWGAAAQAVGPSAHLTPSPFFSWLPAQQGSEGGLDWQCWETVRRCAGGVVEHYYSKPVSISEDYELQRWWKCIRATLNAPSRMRTESSGAFSTLPAILRSVPPLYDYNPTALVDVLSAIVYVTVFALQSPMDPLVVGDPLVCPWHVQSLPTSASSVGPQDGTELETLRVFDDAAFGETALLWRLPRPAACLAQTRLMQSVVSIQQHRCTAPYTNPFVPIPMGSKQAVRHIFGDDGPQKVFNDFVADLAVLDTAARQLDAQCGAKGALASQINSTAHRLPRWV